MFCVESVFSRFLLFCKGKKFRSGYCQTSGNSKNSGKNDIAGRLAIAQSRGNASAGRLNSINSKKNAIARRLAISKSR